MALTLQSLHHGFPKASEVSLIGLIQSQAHRQTSHSGQEMVRSHLVQALKQDPFPGCLSREMARRKGVKS